MKKHIVAGIDIGTNEIKVVVTQGDPNDGKITPKIIGVGISESKGLRHGYIINTEEAVESIVYAIKQAERNCGTKIKKAVISAGGISLQGFSNIGQSTISRGDSEITDMDIDKACALAEKNIPKAQINNRKIIHTIPLSYKIDGKNVFGRPQGMKGNKLEAKVLFITCLGQHFDDLIEAVTDCGIEVLDIVATPVASSVVTLSKNQKVAGCVLADIGADTVSIIVYENNLPVSLEVFPIGSNDITNDIALGLKISIEDAEKLKKGLDVPEIQYSKKKLDEIIKARLSDIFELIENHLKKIDRNGLLPAGIIITGASANINNISELAKDILKLPARTVGSKEASISVAYGLSTIGMSGGEMNEHGKSTSFIKKISHWLKQFMP